MRVFVFEYLSAGGAGCDLALLAQGRAMRDALVADLRRIEGLVVDDAIPAPGAPLLDFVARRARANDCAWIVAPESEALLTRLHEAVAGAARWVGCDAQSIAIASSKRATLERLAARGIATPLSFSGEATRWVVKPDDGAGALATLRHATYAAALADLSARAASATLEAWVEGEALSLSLLCRRGGAAELLAVNRQHIEVDAGGALDYRGVTIDALARDDARLPALRTFAAGIASALPGLAGYVGVDCVWHAARGPVAIEVNPRLTCSYIGLSAALGRNLAREILDAATA